MDIFSICDEVLLYRERVVILSTLQKPILKDFHAGHPESTRMKSLMRSYVHWPNMNKDIENTGKSCKGCTLAAKAPPIKFNPWPKTDLPWFRIHTEFTGPLEGYYYLIVVDSFLKWPEVHRCKNPTIEIMIKFLHELFAKAVETLDNRSQFMSGEFSDFCETYQIEHIMISPYHPRSNGQAQRFVDTLKKARATQAEKPSNDFFKYTGLHLITKHQPHNLQLN